ncbi:MAG TPA: periplasmic heavy metal sensor [Pyrinomonadaceae bacterium]|jgi:Spy/CpxP family protein refolding chaperone|nr:periplasmic heavy metal sensor [Pyrinomonadaceae bacterium]
MKNNNSLILLVLFILMIFAGAVSAQDRPPEGDRMPPPGQPGPQGMPGMQGQPRPDDDRGEILRQLNLSQEQFQSIRKLLADNGPKVREAQRDFREAQEALDDAIYADTVDEVLVQSLTRRSSEAQATLMKLRTINEFAIRRILNPEQVVKFRELRKQQILERQQRQRQERQERQNGDGPGRPGRRPPMGQPGQPGQPAGPGNNALPNKFRKIPA